jgi:hypothetical protein
MDNPIETTATTPSLSKITWLKPGLIGFLIGIILMGIIWCIFRSRKKDTFKAPKPPVVQQIQNPEPQVKSILKKSVSFQEDFVPSAKFKGNKPGYAFKKGSKGQGYYKDG